MTVLSKLDELKAIADAATPWLGKFSSQSSAAVLVTVDADDFRGMLKMYPAMPQLIEALRVAVTEILDGSCICDSQHQYTCPKCETMGRIAQILEVGE